MAYHLLKDYDTAIKLLEEFRSTSQAAKQHAGPKETNWTEQFETSELLLYQAQVYKESGYYKEALDHINRNLDEICDKLSAYEMKVDVLIALGRHKEAAKLLRDRLISRNPENRYYYQKLEQALDLERAREEIRLRHYSDIQVLFSLIAKSTLSDPLRLTGNVSSRASAASHPTHVRDGPEHFPRTCVCVFEEKPSERPIGAVPRFQANIPATLRLAVGGERVEQGQKPVA